MKNEGSVALGRTSAREGRSVDVGGTVVALVANRTQRRLPAGLVVCANRTRPPITGRTNRPSDISRPPRKAARRLNATVPRLSTERLSCRDSASLPARRPARTRRTPSARARP